jgi:hypothetical protein
MFKGVTVVMDHRINLGKEGNQRSREGGTLESGQQK